MTTKQNDVLSTIIDEVKFTIYSSMIAGKLDDLGCYDKKFWPRSVFQDAIKDYPALLTIDANFLVGKYEGFHESGIAELYQAIREANGFEDCESLQRDFGFLMANRFQQVQLMDNPELFPELGYTLEQRQVTLDEECVGEPDVFFGDFKHVPTFTVSQQDLMRISGFDINELKDDKKAEFFSLPLRPESLASIVPAPDQPLTSLPCAGLLVGIAKGAISHVNQEYVRDKAVQTMLLSSNVLKNVEALSAAARVYGGYSIQGSGVDFSEKQLDRLEQRYGLSTETGEAQGMAIFDAAMGQDEHRLIQNSNEYWFDPDPHPDDEPAAPSYWKASAEVFSADLIVTKKKAQEMSYGGMRF